MSTKSKLNNLEYLALRIFLEPGKSGRFYQRKLHQYRYPRAHMKNPSGIHGVTYFAPSGKYFGRLWVDGSHCEVPFRSWSAMGKRPQGDGFRMYLRPKKSKWYITSAGLEYARRAAIKLKLDDTLEKINTQLKIEELQRASKAFAAHTLVQ